MNDLQQANLETRKAWNANAEYWDSKMQEGNAFVNRLIWPPTQQFLGDIQGKRILDAACGNGLYARKLAALGADVVGFDFSEELIRLARARSSGQADRIAYHVADATDERQLLALGEGAFDGALCQMALFDMAEIRPLFRAIARLLRPQAPFVFAIAHPSFNSVHAVRHAKQAENAAGRIVTEYSIEMRGYLTTAVAHGEALRGQPQPHIYFDRPLQETLAAAFEAGFVVDGLEERAFEEARTGEGDPLKWGENFREFPPVMVVRVRTIA